MINNTSNLTSKNIVVKTVPIATTLSVVENGYLNNNINNFVIMGDSNCINSEYINEIIDLNSFTVSLEDDAERCLNIDSGSVIVEDSSRVGDKQFLNVTSDERDDFLYPRLSQIQFAL